MRSAAALLLILLAGAGCGGADPAPGSQESGAFALPWWGAGAPSGYTTAALAAELVHQSIDSGRLWPGFDSPAEFILCPKGEGTLLALREAGSAGASAIPHPSGERYPAQLYYLPRRLRGLEERCLSLGYELEGRDLLAFPELDSMGAIADPVDATAAGVIHDEFHRFQIRHFEAPHGSAPELTEVPGEVVSSPQFRRLAGAERALLATTLRPGVSATGVRDSLRRYLALRDRRTALGPEWLPRSEENVERLEGSAHLVGYQAVLAARGGTRDQLALLLIRELETGPSAEELEEGSWYRHSHIYATGAALGLLLDRLGIDWRTRMQAGETFVELVRGAVAQ